MASGADQEADALTHEGAFVAESVVVEMPPSMAPKARVSQEVVWVSALAA